MLDGRRLNHQVPESTVSPSSPSVVTPSRSANAARTRSVAARWSLTSLLISPDAWYLAYSDSS